jgi:hypothetical protein
MRTSGTNNTVTLTTSSSAQITIHWGDGLTTDKTGALQVSAHTYTDGVAGHSIWIEGGETLTVLFCYSCLLTSLTLPPEWTAMKVLRCYYNALTSLTLPPEWTAMTNLSCVGNALTSLTLPPEWTAMKTLYCYDNALASLTIPSTWTELQNLYCYNNGWSESVVDDVLVDLLATVTANPRAGTLQIHGTNAAPSVGTGCPAYCSLVNAHSWTCTITGSCSC